MSAEQSSSVFEGILTYHSQTRTVDSVFAQPAVTFFLCHVIVELLAVGPSLLLVRRRGTLYLAIYVICHVTIVILDVYYNPLTLSPSTSAHCALEVFLTLMCYINLHHLSIYLSIYLSITLTASSSSSSPSSSSSSSTSSAAAAAAAAAGWITDIRRLVCDGT